jgi:hypothetical protein
MTSRVRCSCGRVYDPQKHTTCPDCGAESAVESVVVAEKTKPPAPPEIEPAPKRDEEKKDGSFAQLLKTLPWPAYAGAAVLVLLVLIFALRPRHAQQLAEKGERPPAPVPEQSSPSQTTTNPPLIPSGGATVPPSIPSASTTPPVIPSGGFTIPPSMATGGVNLAELIANAAPGATVTVPAGLYPGGLVLSRAVHIVGDSHAGGQIFIQSEGKECLSVRAKGVTVENIQFMCNGIGELPAISVADGADLEMEGCKVQSTSALGLLVGGNASIKTLGSGFSATNGTAARVNQQAHASFTQSSFSNAKIGLGVANAAAADLHSCAFERIGMSDRDGAIMSIVGEKTQVTGDDCHFTNNTVGIIVREKASLSLTNCAFKDNTGSSARENAGLVVVRDSAEATIRNSTLVDASPYALNVVSGGTLTLEDTEISGSRTAGLVVGERNGSPAHAQVKHSHFNGNAIGIGILAGSSAEIEDSECHENNDGIVVFDQGSRVKLKKTAIGSNRNHGLHVYGNGEASANDSDIRDNARGAQSGVPHKASQHGSLTLEDCRIGGNQVFGVGACAQSQLILTRCVFSEDSKKNIYRESGAIVQSDTGSDLAPPQEAAEATATPESTPRRKSSTRRTTRTRPRQQDEEDISRIIRRWIPQP